MVKPEIAAAQLPAGPLKGHSFVKVHATNHPQKEEVYDLSLVDNMMPRVWQSASLVFKLEPDADHRVIFEHLVEGMSRMFEYMPILVSELAPQDPIGKVFKARKGPDVYAQCYYREHSDDPDTKHLFSEFQANHFNFAEYNDESPFHAPEPEEGQPNAWLRTQMNFWKEGAILTYSAFHVALDLVAKAIALSKWAQCMVQSYEGNGIEPVDLLPPECYDRALLSKGRPGATVQDMPDQHIINVLEAPQEEQGEVATALFYLPLANIVNLKTAASPVSNPTAWISTADAVEAFIWRHIVRARDAVSKDPPKENSKVLSGVNVRTRLKAVPLHEDYIGSATGMAPLELPRKLLHSKDPAALNEIAYFVRKTLSDWDLDNYMLNIVGAWPKLKTEELIWYKDPGELLITDHSAFPCYVTNFGPDLGVPISWREPYAERPPPKGEVMVMPKLLDGSLEIMVTLEPDAMQQLIRDSEFRQFAEVRGVCGKASAAALLPSARSKL